jgi:hypothetical protein
MRQTTSAFQLATEALAEEAAPPPLSPALSPAAAGVGLGVVAAAWGLLGQLALLLAAVSRLLAAALTGLAGATPSTWALAAGCVVTFCYFQGYRGFQRRYSPFVAGRAAHLARNPRLAHAVLAPLFCCGLVHATRRRRVATLVLYATMVVLAVGIRRLHEPYRAAVELGVACGLFWGAAALLAFAVRALAGRPPATPLDLPAPRA